MKTTQEIRKSFLEYFASKEHLVAESASLLPAYDPTLLFTTAGMVPFKPYFAGINPPPKKRMASVQKCMRTTDIDEVGKTKRHLTFFEMLGNFSFGDYFKKEAIEFAWEYAVEFLNFPKEDIWVTVYLDDDEAYEIWKNHMGIEPSKIHRLGKKDNFWGPAGNTGACGPCSELYLDRGEEYDPQGVCKKPGDEGERFVEFWNLVFNQLNKNEQGKYLPLKKTGIDTGAGLERIASLVQKVDSVFDIDELKSLAQEIASIYKVSYEPNVKSPIAKSKKVKSTDVPVHILTDHVRTLCFCLADGIYPSNESRGYVVRRILRRAMLYAMKLGAKDTSLFKAVDKVADIYGGFYAELKTQKQNIKIYVKNEEERFLRTLQTGSDQLNEIIDKAKDKEESRTPGKRRLLAL